VDRFSVTAVTKYLKSNNIDFIRIQWIDYCSILVPPSLPFLIQRFRVFPLDTFLSFLNSPTRKSVGIAKVALGMIPNDLFAPDFSPTGEYYLMPDLKSLRTNKLEPRYAYLMGDFEEKEGEIRTVDLCPRTILKNIVK
jgi:glutamine synthetase